MKKILIVDDLPEINELIQLTISIRDFKIIQAETGPDALELARTELPDLVLLDVVLPEGGLDGFQVCRTLKDDPLTSHIKIFLLTALKSEGDRKHGYEVGADWYCTKPFSPLELIGKIEEVLLVDENSSGEGAP